MLQTAEAQQPYLSVVMTTRNDDHGGDPLKRLQAFINTFSEQCRRTGLDAEVIVVEWNPPVDRPRVSDLCRVPVHAPFTLRFVEVPAEIHRTLRHADVLPLFQMIAKNVGVRRARGRFILCTNIDIVFSNELVEYLATKPLEPGHLYRLDRHDIEPHFPVEEPLEEQMAYCQTHQIRVHAVLGTYPVDPSGRQRLLEPDVVGSPGIRLGDGWRAREGDATDGFYRWASQEATVSIDRASGSHLARGVVLDLEVEPNPYQPGSWVELDFIDRDRPLARRRVTRRGRVRVALDDDVAGHEILIRTIASSGGREHMPLFECREQLCWRVRHVSVGAAAAHEPARQDPVSSSARAARKMRAVAAQIIGPFRSARSTTSIDREVEARVAALAPLIDLEPLGRLLREQRPAELHQNACGDFQLMAREHWFAIKGYPEFEMFSMSIDGLLEALASAAGVREHRLAMPLCVYHLEHEKGSGWTPEGEAQLRKRIAENGIAWLDAGTVHIWHTYMQWVGRPMIFNSESWGFGDVTLHETPYARGVPE